MHIYCKLIEYQFLYKNMVFAHDWLNCSGVRRRSEIFHGKSEAY